MEHILTQEQIRAFSKYLREEERSIQTIEKYLRDIQRFYEWADGKEISKTIVVEWKTYLINEGRAAVTVNASLAALHSFFSFMGWQECRVKYLRIQRRVFRDDSKELKKDEFLKLVNCARQKSNLRLALVMETICATGIRVSELCYITVEAIQKGRADVALKGKIRTILIPNKLAQKLKKYAKKKKIASGEIFLTANGNRLSRKQIWSEMKWICKEAGIEKNKVFPHNLRHLFARVFYKACHDIIRLADVLGHSSIETTRIYLVTTGTEHVRQLNELGLVV